MDFRIARGFSLLEVMIAVLVFSIGLLGAGLMTTAAVKNSHNSYLRSQASFLADAMVDRMRSNPRGVWNGNYNGALAAGSPAMPGCGTGTGTGCTEAQIAQRDMAVMGNLISQLLPNGTGTVGCVMNGTLAADFSTTRPVDGQCNIAITWAESRDVDRDFTDAQVFTLTVQP